MRVHDGPEYAVSTAALESRTAEAWLKPDTTDSRLPTLDYFHSTPSPVRGVSASSGSTKYSTSRSSSSSSSLGCGGSLCG
jgi:hypothetical protein